MQGTSHSLLSINSHLLTCHSYSAPLPWPDLSQPSPSSSPISPHSVGSFLKSRAISTEKEVKELTTQPRRIDYSLGMFLVTTKDWWLCATWCSLLHQTSTPRKRPLSYFSKTNKKNPTSSGGNTAVLSAPRRLKQEGCHDFKVRLGFSDTPSQKGKQTPVPWDMEAAPYALPILFPSKCLIIPRSPYALRAKNAQLPTSFSQTQVPSAYHHSSP